MVRIPDAKANNRGSVRGASMWDMIAYGKYGKYIFIPHETICGAGGSRYNTETDSNEIMFSGDCSGERGVNGTWSTNDFGAFDPATYTPYGTVLFGEEWSGQGRIIEVMNPYTDDVADIEIKEKQSIANVSHEGLRFSKKWDNVLYYVDEDNSGSIYKCVAQDETFDECQTFVLKVKGFTGNANENYNASASPRTGKARWVPITDKWGSYTTAQDPFENNAEYFARPGRIAADEVGATPFGRPEDIEVGVLSNGKEVLYFTATSEATVYSVQMNGKKRAKVRVFADEASTPKNLGFPATTAILNSPDNLAQDAFGNIYIIEDKPNGDEVGGDIWFVRDVDGNGVAESIDHFMSIQVDEAEATGMIFNPKNPTEFVVSVQHPESTDLNNVPDGFGDALWKFDIKDVVPPTCEQDNRYNRHSHYGDHYIQTCSETSDFNFIDKLKWIVMGW